ncbi:DMT family transporter [Limimaricola pyoseonensis]|uniref:EamA domain-containing membrane protein RarD n=1 Tax=Limimaricola pyoseonensis TaxID=521013 RepID=A0A1G6ZBR9_9RHOB|nr:DMT family transporter [Limimaricola pyoseonensis]SDE00068.1 EamA domain-containing membrane protein RarD [Limimaricola pyoseonensis]
MSARTPLNGIGLRLLAAFLITAMSAMVAMATREVGLGQVVFWRSAVALIPICLYMALCREFPSAIAAKRPGLHLTRSLFGALSMALSFLSLAWLPVANAQALGYLAPVLTLPLAAWFLGERIGPMVWGAAALGFGGVLAMLGSALEAPGQGALIGVAAGLGYAVTMAVLRVHIKAMTASERPSTIAFWFAAVSALAGLATWPSGWDAPSGEMLGWLIGAGLTGGLAHVAATEAVARAPVAVLAPFDFTGLVWALLFDAVLFGAMPDGLGLLGVAAITGAALLVTFASWRPGAQPGPVRPR